MASLDINNGIDTQQIIERTIVGFPKRSLRQAIFKTQTRRVLNGHRSHRSVLLCGDRPSNSA